MPQSVPAQTPGQPHEPQRDANNFFPPTTTHHQPKQSMDTTFGASVRSDTLMHMPDLNVSQLPLPDYNQLSSNQQVIPDLPQFDLGLAEGIDLDEWMYDLAPRPEYNDQNAFMMNLGAIGGNTSFNNMFTYTDLS